MRSSLLLFFSSLLLVACSGKSPSNANFNFVVSGSLTATAQGGLVIFGKNTKGDKFSRIISTRSNAGSVTEILPRGTWSFGAVSWDGLKAFTGMISCAFQVDVPITTDVATVSLTLKNSRCFDSDVVVPATYSGTTVKTFAAIAGNFCEGDVSSRTFSPCTYSETIRPIERGMAGSYSFVIPGVRNFGGTQTILTGEALESSCYNASTNSEPVAAPAYNSNELNVPAFLPAIGFPLLVRAHLGSACEATKGHLLLSLSNPSEAKFYSYTPGGMYLHARTPAASLCFLSGSFPNTSTPASGNGTMASPWLLCSEEQLLAVQKNFNNSWFPTNVASGVYVLGKDMNLQKFVKAGTIGTAPADDCLEDGDTFVPIGKIYSAYPGCALTTNVTSSAFKFDGNGKTISHFRYKKSGEDKVGFIADLQGSLYDVTFSKASVEGSNFTGIVAGSSTGSMVKKVSVLDSEIRGSNYVGGLIGSAGGAGMNMFLLRGQKLKIKADGTIGGIVGMLGAGTLTDSVFHGDIESESGVNYIGGIVGYTPMLISRIASSGSIRSRSIAVGGIVGHGEDIEFARSDMMIQDFGTSAPRYIGGIVGETSSSVTRSLFNGMIKSSCVSGCQIGGIGGTIGIAATYSFSTMNDPSQGGDSGDTATHNTVDSAYNATMASDLCASFAGTCPFTQVAGDVPRLTDAEPVSETPCAQSLNSSTFGLQTGRGTQKNPYILCKPSQLGELPGITGHVAMKANINLSEVSGPIGNFSGNLDGDDFSFFGFNNPTANVDTALFNTVSGSIKNLRLESFKIMTSSCPGNCVLAPLAIQSSANITNVLVSNLEINAASINSTAAGLVGLNSGVLDRVETRGNIFSYGSMGGIARENTGTITNSLGDIRLNGLNNAQPDIGGIAALNSGNIKKTRFRGIIENINGSINVGGIVGNLSANSLLEDNEFNVEAEIHAGSTTDVLGGIVGYSSSNTSVISRNLVRGFIEVPISHGTYVSSIRGDGPLTLSYSYALSAPVYSVETGTISGNSYNSVTMVCSFDVSQSIGNGNATVKGAVKTGGRIYMSTIVDNGSNYNVTTFSKDSADCTTLNGSAEIFTPIEVPVTPTIAALKTVGYDIVDMTVASDRDRAFKAYLGYLTGTAVTTPPVWIFEPEDGGLKLFRFD